MAKKHLKNYLKLSRIIAISLWMFALILFIAGLDGMLTPDYPYRDGAIRNLVINVPLFALTGFLYWFLPKLSDE